VKKEENPAKEALDGGALAQLLSSPGGGKAGTVLLAFGIPGNDGHSTQDGVDPADKLQAEVTSIETGELGQGRRQRRDRRGARRGWMRCR